MKLMCPENRLLKLFLAMIAFAVILPAYTTAQSKKAAAKTAPQKKTAAKTVAKKDEKSSKDARKKDTRKDPRDKAQAAKEKKKVDAKKLDPKKQQQARKDEKRKDDKRRDNRKETASSRKNDTASRKNDKDRKNDRDKNDRARKNDKDKRNDRDSRKSDTASRRKDDRKKSDRDDKKVSSRERVVAKKDPVIVKTISVRKAPVVAKKDYDEKRRDDEARNEGFAAEPRREQDPVEARPKPVARSLRAETIENIANDNTEGEDLQIRSAAINALGSRAGTVVVMEAQTGKVLTIVNQEWGVRNSYRPCSTVKLVTGVAGINEDLIEDNGNIRNQNFRLGLNDALAFSNNVYFQRVGQGLGPKKMNSYGRALGLGEKTGLNMEGEVPGRLPDTNTNGRIYSHGDDTEVTPVQLAVMVSALTNGGRVVVPQIPKNQFQKANFHGQTRQQVPLSREKFEGVLPGMVGAAEYGTARRGVDASLGIAGKTGSCIGKGSWLGLFASVAPVEYPKYAVVVITRGNSERGKFAAGVAGKIYEALRPRLQENGPRNLAHIPEKLRPRSMQQQNTTVAAPATTVARGIEDLDPEEAEDVIEVRPTPPVRTTTAPVQKPLIRKTNSSQPVNQPIFPPVVIKVPKKEY